MFLYYYPRPFEADQVKAAIGYAIDGKTNRQRDLQHGPAVNPPGDCSPINHSTPIGSSSTLKTSIGDESRTRWHGLACIAVTSSSRRYCSAPRW